MTPFSAKSRVFIKRPPKDDAFLTILEGSVRSSKTWTMIPKLLMLCRYKVAGQRVIVGQSKQTVFQNVLSDLFDFAGEENYSFNRQSGELVLFGVRWLVIGAKDIGSERFIRGLTIGVLYIDEVSLVPQVVFNMLMSRLSPRGARAYGTTNPDTPMHWLKTDWIDNKDLQAAGDVASIHFTMADNLSLDAITRARYERMYKGVFYQRYILGQWVIAEGAIYKDSWSDANLFDDATMPIGLLGAGGHVDRFIAIDYGTTNQCVFLDFVDDGRTLWVMREYVWDSAKEYRQKTDAQYADDLQAFMREGGTSYGEVIIDPSAASFKAELVTRGIWHTDANNEVLDGIRVVSSMLAQKKLRFHRDHCPVTISQHQSYAWDEKAAKRGEEKPLKVNDHSCDADRYGVATKIPEWRVAA